MSQTSLRVASLADLQKDGDPPAKSSRVVICFHYLASSSAFVGLASLGVFAGLWQLAVDLLGIKEYVLPAPSAIGMVIVEMFPYLVPHTLVTLKEVLVGFFLAVVLGI